MEGNIFDNYQKTAHKINVKEVKLLAPCEPAKINASYLVSFISRVMTLYPGDVIITGTSYGIGPVNIGDRMRVTIEQIGSIENQISS